MKFTKSEITLMIYLILQLVSVFFKLSDNYQGKLDSIMNKLENEVQKDGN